MNRMKAFLIAVVLAMVSVVGIHYYGVSHIKFNPHEFGVWADEAKFLSREGIVENQDENTVVVFGSSEFNNATSYTHHIHNMFKDDTFTPLLIGRGQSQCLQHAITLASVGNELKNKKVVIILAPQWFQRKGVVKSSYAYRFSESIYVGMLQNDKLSDELKGKLTNRTTTLLEGMDDSLYSRVQLYNRMFYTKDASGIDRAKYQIYKNFNEEKDRLRVVEKATYRGISHDLDKTYESHDFDWEALSQEAEEESKKFSNNEYGYNQDFYNSHKKELDKGKGKNKDRKFRKKSKEYGDLKLFLQVCEELDIEAMVVVAPYGGTWMDLTEFPKETREKTYKKMAKVARKYGATVCDLSGEEYTPYFFYDNSHFSGKGWVKINEAIYKFYKGEYEESEGENGV